MTDHVLTIRVSMTAGLRFYATVDAVTNPVRPGDPGPLLGMGNFGSTPCLALRALANAIERAGADT